MRGEVGTSAPHGATLADPRMSPMSSSSARVCAKTHQGKPEGIAGAGARAPTHLGSVRVGRLHAPELLLPRVSDSVRRGITSSHSRLSAAPGIEWCRLRQHLSREQTHPFLIPTHGSSRMGCLLIAHCPLAQPTSFRFCLLRRQRRLHG